MFKPTTAKTVDEYIRLIEEPRKNEFKKLHQFICTLVPYKPQLFGSIIGYGKFHYKYASGREGDWYLLGLASQKNYISLYVCASKNGKYLPEFYKDQLPNASIGKSCIRFKKIDDIDLDVLTRIISEARGLVSAE